MYNVQRRFLLIAALLFAALAAHAQDVPSGPRPSTKPAAGTVASSGAPTIANPLPAPAQPVAFSHKQHMGNAKMACNDCHDLSRNGETVAMPQAVKCMQCHATIGADKPDVKRIAEAAQNNEPLPWVRVYRVPSFVSFSHRTHANSGAQCEDCHGPVAERETITREKDTSMGGCISCHTQKSAPTGCDTCHQLNSVRLQLPAAAGDVLLASLRRTRQDGMDISVHRFLMALSLP